MQALDDWSILHAVLVIGMAEDLSRSNIVLWAKGALEKGQAINVVDDNSMPTLAEDLAKALCWQPRRKRKVSTTYPVRTTCRFTNSLVTLRRTLASPWML